MRDTYSEAWTIPLHILMWTVITCGFIGALVVLFMNSGSS